VAGDGPRARAVSVPAMLLPLLGVVGGLVLLTYAADQFVVGAARLAAHLRISTVVVGAVVIGFGTSAPELLVSGLAAGRGSLDLAVGNIVGSNVANLTLVLGAAALVTPIVVRSAVLKREAPISFVAVLAFALAVQGGLSLLEGVGLTALLVVSLTIIVLSARVGDPGMAAEVDAVLATPGTTTRREAVRTLFGLLGTVGGAELLVRSASEVASQLGLSEAFIGLTVVAIGTSLPELATAIQAARKAQTDLIVGNLLGSNLFNAAAVGATAAFAGGGQIADPSITGLGVVLMVGVAAGATAFMLSGRRVVRWEGLVLLLAYAGVLPLLA
jgi:cation:H+ antiporter